MSGVLRSLVPEFVRRSYVLKFGMTLLVLGLTIGMIGFVATDQIQATVETGVQSDLADIAAQESRTFQTWHERNTQAAGSLAASVDRRLGGSGDAIDGEFLQERASRFSGTENVYVVDLESDTVTTTTELGPTLEDLEWSSALPDGDRFEGGPRVIGTAGSAVGTAAGDPPRLMYAAPVDNGSQVVVFGVRVRDYDTAIAGENASAFVYVVDNTAGGEFRVLYDSTGQAIFEQYPRGDAQADALFKAQEERARNNDSIVVPNVGEYVTPDGGTLALSASAVGGSEETFIPSYGNVAGTDYTVLVHTPESQAMGFVATVERMGLLVTIGGVIVIALFGVFIGYTTLAAINRLRLKSEEMRRGNLDVDFGTDRVDDIGQLYESMANMRDALRNQIMEARAAREEAESAREEAERTSRHLQTKATEYRDVMQAVAAGNLGQRMDPSERSQAMREIAEEFNAMIGEIERTVAQLKAFADEVAQSSEEVTGSAQGVRSASRQVTESIQEINEGAEQQNASLQSVVGEMSDLSTTVQEIAALSNEVADLSEQTAQAGRRGRDAAREAIAGMNQIESDSREAVAEIERLEAEMEQIDELVEVIAELADQTNMIALNANIEASRADDVEGEDDGFEVVAQEIKELAGETKRAAQSIEERIEHIHATTDETVDSVRETGERIADNTDSVRNAVEALDEIAEYAEETNSGVQEISAATQQQAASTEEVVGMIDEVAGISDRTSREAENVAAAAEEQTAAVTEVTDSASGLSEQASRLSDALGRFRTREVDETLFEVPGDDDGTGDDRDGQTDTTNSDDADGDPGDGDDGITIPGNKRETTAGNPFTYGADEDEDEDGDESETDDGAPAASERSATGDDDRTDSDPAGKTGVEPETDRLELDIDFDDEDLEEADESNIPGGPLGGSGEEDPTEGDDD